MRVDEPGDRDSQTPQEDRDSIWSIPLARRALYFGLFTAYALAGIGFLLWYEIFQHTADTWQQTTLAITQGIGVTTVGAAGLALLTIEGPENIMVVADYLRKRLIEPLEERRRKEAEQRQQEARAEGRAEKQTEWLSWNRRRIAAEAAGEPFDEPPPGTSSTEGE